MVLKLNLNFLFKHVVFVSARMIDDFHLGGLTKIRIFLSDLGIFIDTVLCPEIEQFFHFRQRMEFLFYAAADRRIQPDSTA